MIENDNTDQLALVQEVEESAASRVLRNVCSSVNNVASEIIKMIKVPHSNVKENVNESGENYRKEDYSNEKEDQ